MREFMTINLSKRMATFLLFLSCFDSVVYWVSCVTQAEIDQHFINIGGNSVNLYLATIARFPIDPNCSNFNKNSTFFEDIRSTFDRNCRPAAQMAEPLFLLTGAAL